MAIDFHDRRNAQTYAARNADESWRRAIARIVDPTGLSVVDVGCGGGIYSTALAQMGATQVTGVDSSVPMVEDARRRAQEEGIRRSLSSWALRSGQDFPATESISSCNVPPAADEVDAWLRKAGFAVVGHYRLSERRRTYVALAELHADLRARTGRSTLHELTDEELSQLADDVCERVSDSASDGEPIHEVDHWSVWEARKNDE